MTNMFEQSYVARLGWDNVLVVDNAECVRQMLLDQLSETPVSHSRGRNVDQFHLVLRVMSGLQVQCRKRRQSPSQAMPGD
eukprot:CAMPEP_0170184218 /NCGR_PEP_ID=MMETSP0040_2-20121228/33013_1 /TAXON_ID=641309 /ORGANISM="Lotharella oceanica, Strain CCMP622" /LENGTH=79 /DNA_ID=CAMNT_0010430193 /DNA_START=345 /DNA_END=584 /DNA_ORIENTATION=+